MKKFLILSVLIILFISANSQIKIVCDEKMLISKQDSLLNKIEMQNFQKNMIQFKIEMKKNTPMYLNNDKNIYAPITKEQYFGFNSINMKNYIQNKKFKENIK